MDSMPSRSLPMRMASKAFLKRPSMRPCASISLMIRLASANRSTPFPVFRKTWEMLPGLLEGPLVEIEKRKVVVDGGLRGIGCQRPFVGLEGEAQVLLSRGLVLPLFMLAGPLLVGEGEVLQRRGVIGEESFQRAKDLDGQLRIAVPGLQDAQVGEPGEYRA